MLFHAGSTVVGILQLLLLLGENQNKKEQESKNISKYFLGKPKVTFCFAVCLHDGWLFHGFRSVDLSHIKGQRFFLFNNYKKSPNISSFFINMFVLFPSALLLCILQFIVIVYICTYRT